MAWIETQTGSILKNYPVPLNVLFSLHLMNLSLVVRLITSRWLLRVWSGSTQVVVVWGMSSVFGAGLDDNCELLAPSQ